MRSAAWLQRGFDLVAASAGLLLLGPLMLAIAVWVRLDSPGPALYRQVRVGRGGRRFRIRKFRTMADRPQARDEADAFDDRPALRSGPVATPGPQGVTVGEDPRITRAGRWLRRSKLDELPQLLDVLQGRMAIVGPRPEVPQHVAAWPPALREHLLSVRPGLTDPASLAFADEAERLARSEDPEREYREVITPAKLALSSRYLQQRSLWSDLRIVGATLARVLGSGAAR